MRKHNTLSDMAMINGRKMKRVKLSFKEDLSLAVSNVDKEKAQKAKDAVNDYFKNRGA